MGIFDRLFAKKSEPEKEKEIKDFGDAKVFISPDGKKRGFPATPLLIYGFNPDALAEMISENTTATCLTVYSLEFLQEYTSQYPSIGLIAQSREEHAGEAGTAIQIFRKHEKVRGMALYGAWEYNVERAAKRAIEYQADGIMMPSIFDKDLYNYIFGVLIEISIGAEIPQTVEEHEERLKRYTSDRSPFWRQQDKIISQYY